MSTQMKNIMMRVTLFVTTAALLLSGSAFAVSEPTAGATQVRDTDGATMVYVPSGEFLMGGPISEGMPMPNEWPQHIVYLDGFWIDRTEVTNHQFEIFVQATGYRTKAEREGRSYVRVGTSLVEGILLVKGADWRHPEGPDSSIVGRENEPMLQTAGEDAQAYCEWAGARLPTEAEWEKAACGVDDRRYPWGNEEPNCQYAVMQDSRGVGCGQGRKPWPVGSKPAGVSPYGALDMAGNANEYVADWYEDHYYASSPAINPQGPAADKGYGRVSRDSSWLDDNRSAYSWCRWRRKGGVADDLGGFRCAMSAPTEGIPAETVATSSELESSDKVLFIGDSDSRFLDRYLQRLAASGKTPIAIESKSLATEGAQLLFYSTLSGMRYPIEEIRSGHWKVVVLEQNLDQTWQSAGDFCDYARKFHKTITKAGAETVIFLPWDNPATPSPTLQEIADVSVKCATELGAKVAPVGLAFDRANRERPALNVFLPNSTYVNGYGVYLTTCVLYATLFEQNPVGLAYRMDDVAAWSLEYVIWGLDREANWQISAEDASFLQRVAWETVQEYQTRPAASQ